MICKAAFLAAALSMATSCLAATCYFDAHPPHTYQIPHGKHMCAPQGVGYWTFTLYESDADIPTFDGSKPNAGNVLFHLVIIYDNECNVRGEYTTPKCDYLPLVIPPGLLPYGLEVTSLRTGLGRQDDYVFKYADGKYSTQNNHCGCFDISTGFRSKTGCPCSFAIDGINTPGCPPPNLGCSNAPLAPASSNGDLYGFEFFNGGCGAESVYGGFTHNGELACGNLDLDKDWDSIEITKHGGGQIQLYEGLDCKFPATTDAACYIFADQQDKTCVTGFNDTSGNHFAKSFAIVKNQYATSNGEGNGQSCCYKGTDNPAPCLGG